MSDHIHSGPTRLTVTTPDGRQLCASVSGSGPDLIVLEAGLGISRLYWGPVQDALSGHGTRVVTYDRAGFGGSSPDPQPRTLERLADDLEAVIAALPYRRLVLVGHSWGGAIVRVAAARQLAARRPIHGLVLVDQSDEHARLYFRRTTRLIFAVNRALLVPLARLGLLGPLIAPLVQGLAEPLRRAVLRASTTTTAARASAAEDRQMLRGLQALRAGPPALGRLGISVISGQQASRTERRGRAKLLQAHQHTAALYAQARWVAASRSGHMVPVTQPELIASEALRWLNASG